MSSEKKVRFAKVEEEEMPWAAPRLLNCSEHRVPRKDELATAEIPDTLCLQHWFVYRLLPAVAEGLCETRPWIARRPAHFRVLRNFSDRLSQGARAGLLADSRPISRYDPRMPPGTTISTPFHSLCSSRCCAQKHGSLLLEICEMNYNRRYGEQTHSLLQILD